MKKLSTTFLLTVALGSSVFASDYMAMDIEKTCNITASNSIDKVIATAQKYNDIAIKEKVEFRRLDVNNRDLIISVQEGIKSGAKEVNPMGFKGKPSSTKLPIDYAAQRACKFAISALAFQQETKQTWREAVPGDGYKY